MSLFEKAKTVAVHNGNFHPDDIFAVAVLKMVFRKIKVIRTRDQEIIEKSDIAVDVGGKYDEKLMRFDHHQVGGAGRRSNSIPYASFGLVWKKYGEQVSGSKEIAEKVDRELVQYIDTMDNGEGEERPVMNDIYSFTLNEVIDIWNNTWKEKNSQDKKFLDPIEWAENIIKRLIVRVEDEMEGERIVEEAYQKSANKKIIIINEYVPFQKVLASHVEPLFAVYPDSYDSGNWMISSVRNNDRSFDNRKNLPVSWAGKRDKELAEVSGVSDAVFCHNKLFLAVAKSKDGALKMAEIAIKQN